MKRVNHYYKVELIVRESNDDTDAIEEDIRLLLGGYDIDYFDIDEGLFNSFSPQELSALNKEAKQVILDKIPQSGLLEAAAERRTEMLVVLRALVESAGWKLQVEGEAAPIAR